MAAGSFHVMHITRRAMAAPRPLYQPRDPEPGYFPGQKAPRPAKPSHYVASYLCSDGKHQVHYKNGYCHRYYY